mmetsp:Transcript_26851/g.43419  ORF Transcript_26851/g.43419 Transcript_26851/m.43419 type:complete len:211 (-) Transcript_26851:329-961(-)
MCFKGTPRTAGAPRPFNGTSYSTASSSSSSSIGACVTTTSSAAASSAAWASAVDSLISSAWASFTSSVAVVLCGVPSVFSPSFGLSNFSSLVSSSAFSAFSFSTFSGSGASTSNVSKLCEKLRRLISRFVRVTAKGQVSMTSAAAFSTPDSAIFSNLSSFSCCAMAFSASVGFSTTGGSSGTSLRVEISAEATSQSDTACSTFPATGVTW